MNWIELDSLLSWRFNALEQNDSNFKASLSSEQFALTATKT